MSDSVFSFCAGFSACFIAVVLIFASPFDLPRGCERASQTAID